MKNFFAISQLITLSLVGLAIGSLHQDLVAQQPNSGATVLKPKWAVTTAHEGRDQFFPTLTKPKGGNSVGAFHLGIDRKSRAARYSVWAIDSKGGVLSRTEFPIESAPRINSWDLHSCSCPATDGNMWIAADMSNTGMPVVHKVSSNGELLSSSELDGEKFDVCNQLIAVGEGNFLLLGKHGREAVAICSTEGGATRWVKKKKDEDEAALYSGGVMLDNQWAILAGDSGSNNQFDMGPKTISLMKVNTEDGTVAESVWFQGRLPKVARSSARSIAIVYDKSEKMNSEFAVSTFSDSLKKMWSASISVSPKLLRNRPNLIAGTDGTVYVVSRSASNLYVHAFDLEGQQIANGIYTFPAKKSGYVVNLAILENQLIVATDEHLDDRVDEWRGFILAFDLGEILRGRQGSESVQ